MKNQRATRQIVGLMSEKDDVRQRLQKLLSKPVKATGPDADAYQIMRRTSSISKPDSKALEGKERPAEDVQLTPEILETTETSDLTPIETSDSTPSETNVDITQEIQGMD